MAGYMNYIDMEPFNSMTIKSFRTDDNNTIRGQLIRYHYSSASAIMAILRPNNSGDTYIRFSDIHYMNDKSEEVYFIRQLLRFLDKNRNEYPLCSEVVNNLLLKSKSAEDYINLDVQHVEYSEEYSANFQNERNFIFCMSEAKDSLQMWNYYVHNGMYQGYNIGFDVKKFIKSFDVDDKEHIDPIFIHYGKVLYKETEHFKEIKALLDYIEKKFANKENAILHGAIYLWRYIVSKGAFFKDEGFANEEEYRILIQISENRLFTDKSSYINKNNQKIQLDFYEKSGILIPFLKVPFPKESVKCVTMSPIMEHDIAKKSMEEFLRVNEYENVEVVQSKIPIRY